MKKILNFSEYIFIFALGYLLFNFIITLAQIITYGALGLLLDFYQRYLLNFTQLYIVYFILFIICALINYIYNFCFVNKLNKSLKRYKEDNKDEEK